MPFVDMLHKYKPETKFLWCRYGAVRSGGRIDCAIFSGSM